MPFSVFKAMLESSTPGHFLGEKFASALERNEPFESVLSPTEAERLSSGKFCSKINFLDGKGSRLSFSIGQRDFKSGGGYHGDNPSFQGPRVMINGHSVMKLDEEGFKAALERFPSIKDTSRAPHLTTVLIPLAAIQHFNPRLTSLKITKDSSIVYPEADIRVEDPLEFARLKKISDALMLQHDYLTFVQVAGNPRFRHATVTVAPKTALNSFLTQQRRNAPLFEELSTFLMAHESELSTVNYFNSRKIQKNPSKRDRKARMRDSAREKTPRPRINQWFIANLSEIYSRHFRLSEDAAAFAKRLSHEALVFF
ncbi:MAG: hypothetical protein WC607_02520 [Candidatus Micrarchaeia archaeon]